MGYSYAELKSLQDEQAKWVKRAEECRTLPDTVGARLSKGSNSVLAYLLKALKLLEESGAWKGPDGDSCREAIKELYDTAAHQQTLLQEAAVAMETEARAKAKKIGDKIINEVLPNMSTAGKVETSIHYAVDSATGKNK